MNLDLQARLEQTNEQLAKGRAALQVILDQQEEVLAALHRLEGRAALLQELLAEPPDADPEPEEPEEEEKEQAGG